MAYYQSPTLLAIIIRQWHTISMIINVVVGGGRVGSHIHTKIYIHFTELCFYQNVQC